jgi:putative DNA primase/helicase
MILGTPEGYVDLRTGKMKPADPSLLVSRITAVAPNRQIPKLFKRFLIEVAGNDLELYLFLHRLFGYGLTGLTREQCLAYLKGKPGSGKSTLIEVLAAVLGDYHTAGSITALLVAGKSDPHAPQPFLASLVGARLVTFAETKQQMTLDGPTIARITGGDTFSTRDLHGKAFPFKPIFKAVLYGNDPVKVSGSVKALARRLLVVPFDQEFKSEIGTVNPKTDIELPNKLKAEYGAILGWLIQGCLLWQQYGLAPPPSVIGASRRFIGDADLVAVWHTEHVIQDPEGRLTNDEAWGSFSRWARDGGHKHVTREDFGARLTELLGEVKVAKDRLLAVQSG